MEKGGCTAALAAAGLTAGSRIGFADELRLGLRGTSRRVWGRRGIKVRQRLQLTYQWRYLFAVVDGQRGGIWWKWLPNMRAEELGPVISGLRKMDELDAIVWDNAPSHQDARIQAVAPPTVGLPPYSPELNPAERLFELIRGRVEGRVYGTLEQKMAAAQAIIDELNEHPDQIRSLCGWDWITQAIAALPTPLDHAA